MHTDCRSQVGITIGLIDAIISISRILVDRDWDQPEIQEALADLRQDDNLHQIMDIGDLCSAKSYIAEQQAIIKTLTAIIETPSIDRKA